MFIYLIRTLLALHTSQNRSLHVHNNPLIAAHNSLLQTTHCCSNNGRLMHNGFTMSTSNFLTLQGCHTVKFLNSQAGNFPWKFLGRSHIEVCGRWHWLSNRNFKTEWEDGAWRFRNLVIVRSNYNVSCLGTSGFVMVGNSRMVSGYLCFVGNNDTMWQYLCIWKTIYITVYVI
jgi:hypothetical protein